MKPYHVVMLILLMAASCVALSFGGCKNKQTTEPPAPFTDITRTDETSLVLSTDPDDWKPLPGVGATIKPAYPNPCTMFFSLLFSIVQDDSIVITLNDKPDRIVRQILSERLAAGNYSITTNTQNLELGIYRVYFSVVLPSNVFTTYGDVQITK